jgi:hypothetical protein
MAFELAEPPSARLESFNNFNNAIASMHLKSFIRAAVIW